MSLGFQKINTFKDKAGYYVQNLLRQLAPRMLYTSLLKTKLNTLKNYDKTYILNRVNYYNKLNTQTALGNGAIALGNMQMFKSPKAYNFDTFEYSRYFDKNLKAQFLFGDATTVEAIPTIQKSRPIEGDNQNAVLLKLDKKRHFVFVKDKIAYADKTDMLIGRGVMTQSHRIRFIEQYFEDPLCDVGQVNKTGGNPLWIKPKISIAEHLKYKFVLSLEGNDVATNLKWIMSSNSIAVMPKPKYETWFMEGTLIPDYHYILIKDDFSDVTERLNYFTKHPEKALEIIKNANAFVNQFFDEKREDLISLLVLQKYFYYTGQSGEYELK